MTKIYLALGSNIGSKLGHIEKAIGLLQKSIDNITEAPVYVTKPVGYTKQDDFLNTAISGETKLSSQELLAFVKSVEAEVGRVERFRWGPREIDIDIIFYDSKKIDEPNLQIPHTSFAERDFVLTPLSDLAPDFIDPNSGQTIHDLLEKLPIDQRSVIGLQKK